MFGIPNDWKATRNGESELSKKKLTKQTLCNWSRSQIESEAKTLAKLTSEPAFACRKCARVANKARQVCKPMALPALVEPKKVG